MVSGFFLVFGWGIFCCCFEFEFFWGVGFFFFKRNKAGAAFDAFKFKFSQSFTINVVHTQILQNKDEVLPTQ